MSIEKLRLTHQAEMGLFHQPPSPSPSCPFPVSILLTFTCSSWAVVALRASVRLSMYQCPFENGPHFPECRRRIELSPGASASFVVKLWSTLIAYGPGLPPILVWHLVVVVSVIRCLISGGDGADSPVVSRLWHVAHTHHAHSLHLIISVPYFLTFWHLSHFPAFSPRDTLHVVRSQTLHLPTDPKPGTLGGPSPGYPSMLSIPVPCTHCVLAEVPRGYLALILFKDFLPHLFSSALTTPVFHFFSMA